MAKEGGREDSRLVAARPSGLTGTRVPVDKGPEGLSMYLRIEGHFSGLAFGLEDDSDWTLSLGFLGPGQHSGAEREEGAF